MPQFLKRPLGLIDRLFRVDGAQPAPTQLSTELPIQPVLDVSRMAELGRPDGGAFGLFIQGVDLAHAGADTQEGSYDPYAVTDSLYPNEDVWCWLLGMWAAASASALTAASQSLAYAPLANSIPRRDRLLWYSNAVVSLSDQGVAPATLPVAYIPSATSPRDAMPVAVPPGSVIRVIAISSGAIATERFEGLFWAGPLGARPPGLP